MPVNLLSEILIIIAAAFVGGFLARSLRLPLVLGYIVSGIIFGTLGKNFFPSYNSLIELSQLGVSLLLFTLGFEISWESIKKVRGRILVVGGLQLLLTFLCLLPLFTIFQFDLKVAFLLSILFSFSSTAVVVKILEEKGMMSDFPGDNTLLLLLVQDLFVVPVIFLLPVIFSGNGFSFSQTGDIALIAIKPLLLFIGIIVFNKYFLTRFMNLLFRYPSHELTILATIFVAAASIGVFTYVGLPQSIAAFLAGVILSEQGKNLAPLSEIRPFRDIFLVLFFVMTGILVDVRFLFANAPILLLIAGLVIVTKFLVLYIILRFSKYSPSSSIFISSHLSNIGEFALVIGQIAFLSSYITQRDYNAILSIFAFSLLFLPFWVKYARRGGEKLASFGLLKQFTGKSAYFFKGFEDEELSGHVVICGHGRVGKEVRHLLDLASITYVVVDFNRNVISELSNKSKFVIYGDPTDREVLENAMVKNAKVLVVAVPDSFSQKRIIKQVLSLKKDIIIICRSHREEDKDDLLDLGVSKIIMPELEAGLKIGQEVLSAFNISKENEEALIRKTIRHHKDK